MRRGGSGERGVALLLVVWVLTALAVILSEYVVTARTSLNAARNQREDTVGYYLAMGAFYQALEEIGRPYDYLLPGEGGQVLFARKGEEQPAAEEGAAAWRTGNMPAVGKYSYRLRDEESKININQMDRRQLVEFLREIGMEIGVDRDTVADSILDWRDPDDLHRLNGAEDDYYQGLTPPYHAKNAPFTTVPELLLVRGVTPELFYGGGDAEKSLADQVTVHGDHPNYNTAPPAVLAAWLGPQEAEKVVARRQTQPFTGSQGQSAYFTVEAEGRAEGATAPRRIRAVVSRRATAKGVVGTAVVQWCDRWQPPEEEEAAAAPAAVPGAQGEARAE